MRGGEVSQLRRIFDHYLDIFDLLKDYFPKILNYLELFTPLILFWEASNKSEALKRKS